MHIRFNLNLKTKIFLIAFLILTAHSQAEANLSIICTLYPQFDFTREIVKDLADVKLLLKPGIEPHEFEPTPKDIIILNNADLIIYTGNLMEVWAERIFNALDNKNMILNLSDGIEILNNDPHIWLNMLNAISMVEKIADAVCKLDPENAEFYKNNAQNYISQLKNFDNAFMKFKGREIIFAGEFSYYYFVERYGINYLSAYNGETEAGFKQVAEIIKHVHENNIKYIFCDAFEISDISRQIANETGAQILILNTAHNVPDLNMTFAEIVNDNLKNLELAVNQHE